MANTSNNITIIIKNGNVGTQDVESSGVKGTRPQIDSVESKPIDQSSNKNISKMISMGFVVAQATRVLNDSMQNYINITGKSSFGKNIDMGKQIAGYATQIAFGGVVGAITVAVDVASKGVSMYLSQRQAEYDRQRLIRRNGSITTSGSRGGISYD